MRYHIDPYSFIVEECEASVCVAVSERAHYCSLEEAQAALALSEDLLKLSLNAQKIHFEKLWSERSGKAYLEAQLRTPFDEDVIFTVEEFELHSLGTMLLGNNEYVLARGHSGESLDSLAKRTVEEARRLHRLDIWPDACVVELYRQLKTTSGSIISARELVLHEAPAPGFPQLYRGETLRGTLVTVRVSLGYAVAEISLDGAREIVHEGGLAQQLFSSERERNSFIAKAFGQLLESGSI